MKKYRVHFYNRFANETQTFNVMAKNKYRAGRLFYRKCPRSAYRSCIQYIESAENEHYWTEAEINEHVNRGNRK